MRYRVNGALLHAIARTESGLNPHAIGRNPNGSRDIGLMQINSAWFSTLATYGISERESDFSFPLAASPPVTRWRARDSCIAGIARTRTPRARRRS